MHVPSDYWVLQQKFQNTMIPVSLGNSFLMAGGMIAKMKSLSGHLMRKLSLMYVASSHFQK